MNETLLISLIASGTAIITALITGSVIWYTSIRKTPKEMKLLDAQSALDFTTSFKVYAEGLDTVVKTLMSTIHELETRLDGLETHKSERSRQIYDLQQTLAEVQRKEEIRDREYVIETQSLRAKIAEFERKNMEYKQIIERLLEVLNKVDPRLLDGIDLTDTLKKIRTIK